MSHFNHPKRSAYSLAQKLRRFRANTETTALSEVNPNAEQHRIEIVRQIDWAAFNQVVQQLEFCYLQELKEKSNS